MSNDIESARTSVDIRDNIPRNEEKLDYREDDNKADLEESVKAINYANRDVIPSTRPTSVNSGRPGTSVHSDHARLSYELQELARSIAQESKTSLNLQATLSNSRIQQAMHHSQSPVDYASRTEGSPERPLLRVDTMGSEAEVTIDQEDVELAKFLVSHFKTDIFNIKAQKNPNTLLDTILNSVGFYPKSVRKPAKSEPQVTMELSLAALSRMRMRRLQMKLSHRIMRMHYYEEVSDDWESLLEQYITATRDNDYIHTCVERGLHDPFLVKSERDVDAAILNAALFQIPEEKREKEFLVCLIDGKEKFNLVPPIEQGPTAIGGTRSEMTRKQRTEAFLQRILVSIVGGAFLVGPMWLMILVNSKYASLISTSVFVFVWGVVAARVLDNPIAVLSTTAAYAAVLVVFVGTNNAPT